MLEGGIRFRDYFLPWEILAGKFGIRWGRVGVRLVPTLAVYVDVSIPNTQEHRRLVCEKNIDENSHLHIASCIGRTGIQIIKGAWACTERALEASGESTTAKNFTLAKAIHSTCNLSAR